MSTERKQVQGRRPQPARSSRRRTRTPLVLLLAALFIATPMAAWGTWSSQDTLQANASAGSVAPPTALQCERVSGGLLQSAAEISWDAPSSAPSGTNYEVLIDDGNEISSPPPVEPTSITLDRGLLSNVLIGLLELLLGGGEVEVTVVAVHPSGWKSEESLESVQVTGSLLGVHCA